MSQKSLDRIKKKGKILLINSDTQTLSEGQLDLVYIFDSFYLASLFPDGKQALSEFINCNFHRNSKIRMQRSSFMTRVTTLWQRRWSSVERNFSRYWLNATWELFVTIECIQDCKEIFIKNRMQKSLTADFLLLCFSTSYYVFDICAILGLFSPLQWQVGWTVAHQDCRSTLSHCRCRQTPVQEVRYFQS